MRQRRHVQEPAEMHPSAGYSHAVTGAGLVFVSGQVPLDASGELVGLADPAGQAEQVFRNLTLVLTSVGSDLSRVLKLTYFLTDMSDLRHVAAARDRHMDTSAPAASTVVEVEALYDPRVRIEIEAVALA
jgi:enamine deaminase RidA (YjgF/YER057c/UK114 family)